MGVELPARLGAAPVKVALATAEADGLPFDTVCRATVKPVTVPAPPRNLGVMLSRV